MFRSNPFGGGLIWDPGVPFGSSSYGNSPGSGEFGADRNALSQTTKEQWEMVPGHPDWDTIKIPSRAAQLSVFVETIQITQEILPGGRVNLLKRPDLLAENTVGLPNSDTGYRTDATGATEDSGDILIGETLYKIKFIDGRFVLIPYPNLEVTVIAARENQTPPPPVFYQVKETVIHEEEVRFYEGQNTPPPAPDHRFGFYPLKDADQQLEKRYGGVWTALKNILCVRPDAIVALEDLLPWNAPDHFLSAGAYANRWIWYSQRDQSGWGLYELFHGLLEAGAAVGGVEIGAGIVKGGVAAASPELMSEPSPGTSALAPDVLPARSPEIPASVPRMSDRAIAQHYLYDVNAENVLNEIHALRGTWRRDLGTLNQEGLVQALKNNPVAKDLYLGIDQPVGRSVPDMLHTGSGTGKPFAEITSMDPVTVADHQRRWYWEYSDPLLYPKAPSGWNIWQAPGGKRLRMWIE